MANIVCISHSAELSGATLVLLGVVKFLAEKGHNVSIIFPNKIPQFPKEFNLSQVKQAIIYHPEISLKEAVGIGTKIRIMLTRLQYINAVRKYIKKEKAELVYVNTAMAIYGGLAGKLAGRKILWHIHEDLVPNLWNRIRIFLIKRLAQTVIFVASIISRPFGKKPVKQNWVFVSNPVAIEKFSVSPAEARKCRRELNIPENAFVILNVGFISKRKGIDILLKAYARIKPELPDSRLVIVGSYSHTPSSYWNELQQIIAQNKLEENVYFTGHREDVARLMAMSDLLVLSSRNEAVPICVLEAMATGIPVVATNVGAIVEILEQGKLGIIVPPEDDVALAEGIRKIITDQAKKQEFCRLAQQKARESYNSQKIFAQIEKVILDSISGNG
ncbi:MAG: glycosyltransferase family 4 protein [Candidatus Sumerlaeia bacterium]|nr:glycosyltransferase family 4 protein [Candidatus Sumerlaeia bacterium]